MEWVPQNTTLGRARPPPPVQRPETEIEIGDDVHELASSIHMLALSMPTNVHTLVVASASMARTYALRRGCLRMHIVATVRPLIGPESTVAIDSVRRIGDESGEGSESGVIAEPEETAPERRNVRRRLTF